MTFCPVCGNQVDSTSQFCGACGTQLGGSPSAAAPATPPAPVPLAQQGVPLPGHDYRGPATTARRAPAFFAGDWGGAVRANAIGLGAMLGMSFLVTLIANAGG